MVVAAFMRARPVRSRIGKLIASLFLLWSLAANANYSEHPEAAQFVQHMVKTHGFDAAQVKGVLVQAQKQQAILDAIARPAERTKPWHEYRQIFLGEERIQQGAEFWRDNRQALASVAERYGVEPAVIVAIIGVETRYGQFMGRYRVIDALATLGFDYPPRATFFRGQLEHFLLMVREHELDPSAFVGSYAGAMGLGQFIPSSYRHYARSFSGQGFADIWHSREDAIASVANYFKAHGWQTGAPVMIPAQVKQSPDAALFTVNQRPELSLAQLRSRGFAAQTSLADDTRALALQFEQPHGPEYWVGFNNFYVITRYNRSTLYARAVWELSEAISKAYGGMQL